ncbi:hypothetical protein EBF04_00340 [Streptomyces sp. I6]|nr:hypothetical protein EBF04_00340 [Streptomyces sp. I6]
MGGAAAALPIKRRSRRPGSTAAERSPDADCGPTVRVERPDRTGGTEPYAWNGRTVRLERPPAVKPGARPCP